MRLLSLIPVAMLFTACAGCSSEQRPTLTEQQMEVIIYDLQIADAYAATLAPQGKPAAKSDSANKFYAEIFQRHRITELEFQRSVAAYGRQPAQLDTIYAHVLKRLEEGGASTKTVEPNSPPVPMPVQAEP